MMTDLRYEPLPRIRQQLPFAHPMRHRKRVAAFECVLAVLLVAVLLLLWWAAVSYAGDPALDQERLIWQQQQETYDFWQRERFHRDHESDRRLYGINPPQEEIRTYRLPEGDDDDGDE
jgi:hypothetical protein